jgi:type VI secretion system protein ImpJ
MKQLQPVLWTKGTFLTPQHLQLQDRFLEDSVQFRLSALKFCAWGFSDILIDEEALASGELKIITASGIFPDGLLFDVPGSDPAPPSKVLADFFDPGVRDLDIYLTVPNYRQGGINVAPLGTASGARFLTEITTLRDENTGTGEKPIQVARKNLRLLAANETREGCSALRIANVQRDESGTFRLNPRFAPPLLEVRASSYLQGLINGLLEKLFARSSQLAAGRRQRNQSLADFTSSDIANFWLLYTVNTHIPALNHLMQGQRCHPEELFSAVTALAASLTTFSTTIRPRDLPLYDHFNLSTVFADLDEKLRLLLDTVIPTTVVSLPLAFTKNSIYATAIDRDKYFAKSRMYLAVSADIGEEQIINKVPQLVKLCSAARIEQLITSALPGISLTHMPRPPAAIPVKMKHQYFSLNQSGAAWEAVARDRSLAAHVPGEFPNPEMELIIVLPQAE